LRFTTREIALIGILGATNGAMEITLGNYLHLLHFPFKGNILIGLNCIVYMFGRKAVPQKGVILLTGIISAFLKFLFGWNISAAIAILIEAVLMEIAVNSIGFNITGVVTGTVMANIWAFFHKVITFSIMGGGDFVVNLSLTAKKILDFINLSEAFLYAPIIIIVVIYTIFGIFFGCLGWKMVNKLFPRIAGLES